MRQQCLGLPEHAGAVRRHLQHHHRRHNNRLDLLVHCRSTETGEDQRVWRGHRVGPRRRPHRHRLVWASPEDRGVSRPSLAHSATSSIQTSYAWPWLCCWAFRVYRNDRVFSALATRNSHSAVATTNSPTTTSNTPAGATTNDEHSKLRPRTPCSWLLLTASAVCDVSSSGHGARPASASASACDDVPSSANASIPCHTASSSTSASASPSNRHVGTKTDSSSSYSAAAATTADEPATKRWVLPTASKNW